MILFDFCELIFFDLLIEVVENVDDSVETIWEERKLNFEFYTSLLFDFDSCFIKIPIRRAAIAARIRNTHTE